MDTQQPEQRRRGRFISLRLKLLVGFTLLFSLVFAAAFYWFYTFATQRALDKIRQDLLDTLAGAAAGVDGDELLALYQDGRPNAAGQAWLDANNAETDEDYARLTETAKAAHGAALPGGFSDDPRYHNQLEWLQRVHDVQPQAWPYTYVPGDDEAEVVFLVDLWARYNAEKALPFQYAYVSSEGLQGNAYRGLSGLVQKNNLEIYEDDWGEWISAYRPVVNSQGEPVGAIGVDFEADYVRQVQQAIIDRLAVAFAITYATLFVLVFVVSRLFTRPIVTLTQAAERIGEGDYNQNLSGLSRVRFPDEIGTLAEVFEIMVAKVYQREQSLRRKVEELQIEIDEAKRQKQVSEIVDTGFFQELQEKARTMRRRRWEGQLGDETPAA